VDTLVWLLFESIVALGIILALVNFFLLVHWRRSGRPRPLLIGLAASLVLLVVQGLVVTKREHAAAILQRVEADLLAARVDALDRALSAGFRAGSWDHDGFVDFARRQLELVKIHWLRRSSPRVEQSQKDRFVVSVGYLADVTVQGFVGAVRSRWRITFMREGDEWRVETIDPPEIERHQYCNWRQVGR
jgi:hypothetical protein